MLVEAWIFKNEIKTRQFWENCNARPAYGFVTYLMEYAFTFTFASREFPRTCVWCIVHDSINRPGDLDLWPFDLLIGSRVTRVMGFHPANFVLARPFRSRVRSRQATDRQTDRQNAVRHFIMPSTYGRSRHKNLWTALTLYEISLCGSHAVGREIQIRQHRYTLSVANKRILQCIRALKR